MVQHLTAPSSTKEMPYKIDGPRRSGSLISGFPTFYHLETYFFSGSSSVSFSGKCVGRESNQELPFSRSFFRVCVTQTEPTTYVIFGNTQTGWYC